MLYSPLLLHEFTEIFRSEILHFQYHNSTNWQTWLFTDTPVNTTKSYSVNWLLVHSVFMNTNKLLTQLYVTRIVTT
jgi:hypothetical protein